MSTNLSVDTQYKKWIVGLKDKIQGAQIKAAITVNRELLNLYWELGKEITAKQQQANWGEALIDQLAKDLSTAFPGIKGFSRANLFFIRKWVLFYQPIEKVSQAVRQSKNGKSQADYFAKVSQLVRQIPWGHNREIIMKCPTVEEAVFYVTQTIQNNGSRAVLLLQIESKLYMRQGKAIHKYQVMNAIPESLKGELPSIEEIEKEIATVREMSP